MDTFHFNVTEFVKGAIIRDDWTEEANGFVLKTKTENAFSILATSDHSLYSPYIRINTDGPPIGLRQEDDINPPSQFFN